MYDVRGCVGVFICVFWKLPNSFHYCLPRCSVIYPCDTLQHSLKKKLLYEMTNGKLSRPNNATPEQSWKPRTARVTTDIPLCKIPSPHTAPLMAGSLLLYLVHSKHYCDFIWNLLYLVLWSDETRIKLFVNKHCSWV